MLPHSARKENTDSMRDCRGVRICAKCYLGICRVSRLIFIRPIRVIRVQKKHSVFFVDSALGVKILSVDSA